MQPTTFSRRNLTKIAEVTEPQMMSCAIMPSNVRTGRIENRCPRTKQRLWKQRAPSNDQPILRLGFFLFLAASSIHMTIAGSVTISAKRFINIDRSRSFRSNALIETVLREKCNRRSDLRSVGIEIEDPRRQSSSS